jgi:Tol biopolymer transport system component
MRVAAVLAVFATAVLLTTAASGSRRGSYVPPPGDCCPQWSPNGTQIVFTTGRADSTGSPSVGVVDTAGGPDRFVPGIPVGTRSPDWTQVAYVRFANGVASLTVAKVDGSGEHVVATVRGDRDWTWSPDSTRLAFVAPDGSLGLVGADGAGRLTLAHADTAMPAWSPGGTRIAYVSGDELHVVDAAGGNDTVVAHGTVRDPRWAPDGTRLSFGRGDDVVVVRIGGSERAYPAGSSIVDIGWLPNGSGLLYLDARDRITRLDPPSAQRHVLAVGAQAALSPDGARIAFEAGAECRDRVGVYVVRTDGRGLRRLTNSCTITGTPGPDVLHADFSRVVLGLGGNDRLYADDTYYFFDGNTLVGGPGNDRLVGGFARDTLDGGPGDDVLTGGGSADVLIGGPGNDHIAGGGGGDTIYARDGQRDRISCGKNGYGKAGRDVVYADRVDVVASDCEVVRRR